MESGLRTALNWPKIQKVTMASQFSDMTSLSNIFDIFLFLLSSLVTGPQVSCQYHHWFSSYGNFLLEGIDQKSRNQKYPCLSFAQYLETGVSYGYQT